MPKLKLAEILQARQAKLNPVIVPTTTSVSISHGLPTSSLNAIAIPPVKKIFSILSWNIRDYKGDKISSESPSEKNLFVNQLVKIVVEKLL